MNATHPIRLRLVVRMRIVMHRSLMHRGLMHRDLMMAMRLRMRSMLHMMLLFKMPGLSVWNMNLVVFMLQRMRVLFVERVLRMMGIRPAVRSFLNRSILPPRFLLLLVSFAVVMMQHLSHLMLQGVADKVEGQQHNEDLKDKPDRIRRRQAVYHRCQLFGKPLKVPAGKLNAGNHPHHGNYSPHGPAVVPRPDIHSQQDQNDEINPAHINPPAVEVVSIMPPSLRPLSNATRSSLQPAQASSLRPVSAWKASRYFSFVRSATSSGSAGAGACLFHPIRSR